MVMIRWYTQSYQIMYFITPQHVGILKNLSWLTHGRLTLLILTILYFVNSHLFHFFHCVMDNH